MSEPPALATGFFVRVHRRQEPQQEVILVNAAAAGAAAAAAIAQAIKASGVLVRVSPDDFQKVLRKVVQPLVIYATGGLLGVTINI